MGCVFVMQEGSDLVRKAKLNLVDLAGSERVSRTNSDGMLLKEAKYINLSLHYLEQVIIALQVCSCVAIC
jgi:kinesin family member 6/9